VRFRIDLTPERRKAGRPEACSCAPNAEIETRGEQGQGRARQGFGTAQGRPGSVGLRRFRVGLPFLGCCFGAGLEGLGAWRPPGEVVEGRGLGAFWIGNGTRPAETRLHLPVF